MTEINSIDDIFAAALELHPNGPRLLVMHHLKLIRDTDDAAQVLGELELSPDEIRELGGKVLDLVPDNDERDWCICALPTHPEHGMTLPSLMEMLTAEQERLDEIAALVGDMSAGRVISDFALKSLPGFKSPLTDLSAVTARIESITAAMAAVSAVGVCTATTSLRDRLLEHLKANGTDADSLSDFLDPQPQVRVSAMIIGPDGVISGGEDLPPELRGLVGSLSSILGQGPGPEEETAPPA